MTCCGDSPPRFPTGLSNISSEFDAVAMFQMCCTCPCQAEKRPSGRKTRHVKPDFMANLPILSHFSWQKPISWQILSQNQVHGKFAMKIAKFAMNSESTLDKHSRTILDLITCHTQPSITGDLDSLCTTAVSHQGGDYADE